MKRPKYTDDHRYPNGYKLAIETDVRKTFHRIREEHKANEKEQVEKVRQFTKEKRKA